jgi:hypothetical protein
MTTTRRKKARDKAVRIARLEKRLQENYCRNGATVEGSLEKQICRLLCHWELLHVHHPKIFSVRLPTKKITYGPDIEVMSVFLEPHDYLDDPQFLEKMVAFGQQYPRERVILIASAYELRKLSEGPFAARLSTQELPRLRSLILQIAKQASAGK